jgi:hypothetical protein
MQGVLVSVLCALLMWGGGLAMHMNTSSSGSLQCRKAASVVRGSFDVWHKLDYLMGDCI